MFRASHDKQEYCTVLLAKSNKRKLLYYRICLEWLFAVLSFLFLWSKAQPLWFVCRACWRLTWCTAMCSQCWEGSFAAMENGGSRMETKNGCSRRSVFILSWAAIGSSWRTKHSVDTRQQEGSHLGHRCLHGHDNGENNGHINMPRWVNCHQTLRSRKNDSAFCDSEEASVWPDTRICHWDPSCLPHAAHQMEIFQLTNMCNALGHYDQRMQQEKHNVWALLQQFKQMTSLSSSLTTLAELSVRNRIVGTFVYSLLCEAFICIFRLMHKRLQSSHNHFPWMSTSSNLEKVIVTVPSIAILLTCGEHNVIFLVQLGAVFFGTMTIWGSSPNEMVIHNAAPVNSIICFRSVLQRHYARNHCDCVTASKSIASRLVSSIDKIRPFFHIWCAPSSQFSWLNCSNQNQFFCFGEHPMSHSHVKALQKHPQCVV